jgi:hypothetical protein
MSKKRKRAPSRPRGEWVEIIKAWKDSGLSAAQFADEQGLQASSLAKWQWRLRRKPKRPSEAGAPRLVQVSVADLMGTGDTSTGRWELTTIEGHRLRVLTPMASAELDVLLGALVHGRGRR